MKASASASLLQGVPRWMQVLLGAVVLAALLAALALLPIPLPPYLDFQVLYQTDMGLLRGISPYDHAGQVQMIAQLAGVDVSQVYSLPFPYPPWYALVTAWLAWLPISQAVRVWFGLNLVMLLGSVSLLTEGWPPMRRLMALGLALFFLPVLGSLAVGQYGFPVLLGAALLAYAVGHEHPALFALAASLLTFKPHLGGPIVLVFVVYLLLRRDAFGRRVLTWTAAAAAALLLLGFLADRSWPMNYLRSLAAYGQDPGVASCGLCASLPVLVAGGGGLPSAFGVAAAALVLLMAWWVWPGRRALATAHGLLAASILTVLLASPYLLNYDFILLLVPLVLLAGVQRTAAGWGALAACYALPFAALGMWGRSGNFVFPVCAAIVLVMLARPGSLLDGSQERA